MRCPYVPYVTSQICSLCQSCLFDSPRPNLRSMYNTYPHRFTPRDQDHPRHVWVYSKTTSQSKSSPFVQTDVCSGKLRHKQNVSQKFGSGCVRMYPFPLTNVSSVHALFRKSTSSSSFYFFCAYITAQERVSCRSHDNTLHRLQYINSHISVQLSP